MEQETQKFGYKRINNVFQEAWNGDCHPGFVFVVFYLPGFMLILPFLDKIAVLQLGMSAKDAHVLIAPFSFLLAVMLWRSCQHAKRWYIRLFFRLVCIITFAFSVKIITSYTGQNITMDLHSFTELNY